MFEKKSSSPSLPPHLRSGPRAPQEAVCSSSPPISACRPQHGRSRVRARRVPASLFDLALDALEQSGLALQAGNALVEVSRQVVLAGSVTSRLCGVWGGNRVAIRSRVRNSLTVKPRAAARCLKSSETLAFFCLAALLGREAVLRLPDQVEGRDEDGGGHDDVEEPSGTAEISFAELDVTCLLRA